MHNPIASTQLKIELLEALVEISNGLSMGWNLANVRDDAERARLQAPTIAAQEACDKAIARIEAEAIYQGDDQPVSRAIYGDPDFIRNSAEAQPETLTLAEHFFALRNAA